MVVQKVFLVNEQLSSAVFKSFDDGAALYHVRIPYFGTSFLTTHLEVSQNYPYTLALISRPPSSGRTVREADKQRSGSVRG